MYSVGYIDSELGFLPCDSAHTIEEGKEKADAMLRAWARLAGFQYRPMKWKTDGAFEIGTTIGKEFEGDPEEHEIYYAVTNTETN